MRLPLNIQNQEVVSDKCFSNRVLRGKCARFRSSCCYCEVPLIAIAGRYTEDGKVDFDNLVGLIAARLLVARTVQAALYMFIHVCFLLEKVM